MITKPKIQVDIAKVEALAGLGLNKEQIARSLGMSYATLNRNRKVSKELQDAIKRGEAKSIAFVSNKLREQINAGNLGAIIFYLKCKGGFVETQKQIIAEETETESSGLSDLYARMAKANKR